MAAISSGGQPWNVESVTESERRASHGTSAKRRREDGSSRRSAARSSSRIADASRTPSKNAAILRDRMPAQVVADGDVEDGVALRRGDAAELREDRDEEPRLRVLAEGVLDRELLRPLHVEADGPHVDARARNRRGGRSPGPS